jgi:hypothetical protein
MSPDRSGWPWRWAPVECTEYDEALWWSCRHDTDGELPEQPLEYWLARMRHMRWLGSREAEMFLPVGEARRLTDTEHQQLIADLGEMWRRCRPTGTTSGVAPAPRRPASPYAELTSLLRAVAEDCEPSELETFAFQARWAIDNDPRLDGIDRADAHRRLALAVAHATRPHGELGAR